jgi:hypothetical protein
METNNNDFIVVTQEDVNDSILNQFGFKLGDKVLVLEHFSRAGEITNINGKMYIIFKLYQYIKPTGTIKEKRELDWLTDKRFKVLPRYKQICPKDIRDYITSCTDVFIRINNKYYKIREKLNQDPSESWTTVALYLVEGFLYKIINMSNIFDYEYYIK